MKYYITADGVLHAFDDNTPEDLLEVAVKERSLTPATQAQIDAVLNPTPTPEQQAANVRAQRTSLLADLDAKTVTLRWVGYTEEYQKALTGYRQALLDVTKQPGFPTNVTWPAQPKA